MTDKGYFLVRIPHNLSQTYTLLIMSLCFVLATFLALTQPLPHAENPLLLKISMGYIGFPCAIAFCGNILSKLCFKKYVFILSTQGIYDATNAFSSGFIAWEDINHIYAYQDTHDTYLCIEPSSKTWTNSLPKKAKILAQANIDAGFSPIRIQLPHHKRNVYTVNDLIEIINTIHPEKITKK